MRPGDAATDPVVYIVDDDPPVCRALTRLFRAVGLSAETFPSAQAFLDHPLVVRPMCLVLDIRLPGPSGLDLQDVLAQAGWEMPIVFITGHGDVPTTVRAMRRGAVDFLQKPFDDRDVLECVQRALAHSCATMAARAERSDLQGRFGTLTPRERDVLLQIITGKLNKQIAGDLRITEKTIKIHRGRVMHKMRAGSVPDLMRMAEKLGLG